MSRRSTSLLGMIVMSGWLTYGRLPQTAAQTQTVQRYLEAKHGTSKALSSQVQNRPLSTQGAENVEIENRVRLLPVPVQKAKAVPSLVTPTPQGGVGKLDVLADQYFKGVGWDMNSNQHYQVRVSPPDTNGAIGPQEYVQWVNEAYGIFDKKTRDLKAILDPGSGEQIKTVWDGNSIWQGFGGKCEFSNDGDPIVMYDRLANPSRWVMSQFAHSKPNGPPYSQCIAVSKTSDPAGEYSLYEFQFNNFNDYPKFGVWPDGYYATFNMFEDDGYNSDFLGAKVCAFERAQMLQGAPASIQCVNLYSPQYGGVLPADFDGTPSSLPLAGSPEVFVGLDGAGLNMWQFSVNWKNPGKSTFNLIPTVLAVAPFDYPCVQNSYEISCIAQPGTTTQRLQSLGDRLMYRLAYRNLGTRESLVVNHTVAVGANTGIRWYEITDPFKTPTIRQQGTFGPDDGLSRWIGSIAMDKKGNIILEYTVSGDKTYPSMRYTGRRNEDPLGQMRTEREVVAGSGSQINSDGRYVTDRWGDYSNISVDSSDDCTFWFTNQYQAKDGTYNWNTAITSVKFPDCR